MYRIGIDVGGTLTDVIPVRETAGDVYVAKVLNEPGRRAATVVRGIKRVMDLAGVQSKDVQFIGHGTTIATNAVIERKGAKTVFVANASSDVQPEFREYPRTSTTVFAAYVSPVMRK
jgi:N-methylhydantoinase A